jgi:hypothetical protein
LVSSPTQKRKIYLRPIRNKILHTNKRNYMAQSLPALDCFRLQIAKEKCELIILL